MNVLLTIAFLTLISFPAFWFYRYRRDYNKSKGKPLVVDWGYIGMDMRKINWVAFDELNYNRHFWGFTSKPTMSHGTWIGEGKYSLGSDYLSNPTEILYNPIALRWEDSLIERPKS